MHEVEIRFEREGLEGLVPVGTYLSGAASRFGVRFDDPCDLTTEEHCCVVDVTAGADLLSEQTVAEKEFFSKNEHGKNARLACQAKIERPGEIVIMTKKKDPEPEPEKDQSEEYRKQFVDLPLQKKMSELVQLEAIALTETLAFVINSPFKVADKLMDVMAGFGFSKEEAEKSAAKPEEHRAESEAAGNGKASDASDKTDEKPKTD